MPTLTLRQQNDKVLTIDRTAAEKLGRAWTTIKKALAKVDPDRLLVFSQAHEIERLEARNVTLGFIVAQVEEARNITLREFNRLKAQGVDVDNGAVEAVRTCLVEKGKDNGQNGG
jgi:hypothetical protein